MPVPNDYLERVYAGVLGKLIGVYLGRPFEGWTYQRIIQELGPIEYYVHERLNQPLVVTDDDIAGTFTFLRALEDYGTSSDLSAEDIGKAWLNYIVEERSILLVGWQWQLYRTHRLAESHERHSRSPAARSPPMARPLLNRLAPRFSLTGGRSLLRTSPRWRPSSPSRRLRLAMMASRSMPPCFGRRWKRRLSAPAILIISSIPGLGSFPPTASSPNWLPTCGAGTKENPDWVDDTAADRRSLWL